MYLLPISDIHLEFEIYDNNGGRKYPNEYFSLPKRKTDAETILLLLGDIGVINRKHTLYPFLEQCSNQYLHVFYVPGNHEYYGGSLANGIKKIKENIKLLSLPNVTVLNNEAVTMFGRRFIGSTLWTDFNKKNHTDIMSAYFGMTDYKVIRTGTLTDPYLKTLSPYDVIVEHDNAVEFIKSELKKSIEDDIPSIVLTHHLPSYKSVHPKYDGDSMNCCYASDLDLLIMDYVPKYWFHGHTHDSMDYMLFNTRVMCNPRGYTPGDLNENFEPEWLIPL